MKANIKVQKRYVDEKGKLNIEVELFIANSIEIYSAKAYDVKDCIIDIMEQICYKHSRINFDFEPLTKEMK